MKNRNYKAMLTAGVLIVIGLFSGNVALVHIGASGVVESTTQLERSGETREGE